MTQLREKLLDYFDINLRQVIISGAKKKDGPSKVRIRPVIIKEQLLFQCTKTIGPKEFHSNHEKEEILDLAEQWMEDDFKQLQLESELGELYVLTSKKGKMTIKEKKKMVSEGRSKENVDRRLELAHNRKKHYILEEGQAVDFLIDLGVMTQEGKIVRTR